MTPTNSAPTGRRFPARTRLRHLPSLVFALVLLACGGEKGTNPNPPPPPATVASVTIAPDSLTLRQGATGQFTATPRDAQGAAMSGQTTTWASGNAAIATVSASGLVSAVGPGRAEVTATSGGQVGRAVVQVRLPFDTLAAAATDLAGQHVPERRPPDDTSSYRRDHPLAVGVPVSVSTLKVLLRPTATVGEVNTLLKDLKAEIAGGMPGGPRGGLLILRLPTTTHAGLDSALTLARARAFVRAAAVDVQLSEGDVTTANGGTPASWTWLTNPGGGNYGLELMRVPQLWNLNTLVRRRGLLGVTELGIYDVGFGSHDDLVVAVNRSPGVAADHGLHVAGTAAATVNNGRGIDGVTPFASLVLEATAGRSTWLHALRDLIVARPSMRVVNVSLAYNWRENNNGLDTDATPWAQLQASADGAILDWLLQGIETAPGSNALPVIVAAAGNDSRPGIQQAKWASPFNAAGLIHGNKSIVVVENVDSTRSRFESSNVNGHVAAPGANILSLVNATAAPATCTTGSNCYDLMTGTSMAAPHVTGLVAYLFSLSPALTGVSSAANPILDHLLANTRTATGGASAMVDAFFAAMDLDRLEGGDRILKGLLDIDDGSPDGNLRIDAQGQVETRTDIDGDGFRGDGVIDMSDFRAFRDALMQIENSSRLSFDGAATHPKRDLNGDQVVGTPVQENTFPRADFNGDGLIDASLTRLMRGALNGQVLTDLQVFQSRFNDPHYQANQLPNLLDSGDIAVLLQQCAGLQGVATLRLQARVQNTTPIVQQRTVPATEIHPVFTLPVHSAGYTIAVDALNASGNVVASAEGDLPVALGGDASFGPVCKELRITTTPLVLQSVPANVATPVTILVEERLPGAATWTRSAGAILRLTMTNGTLSSASGTTDSQGEAVVGVTWNGTGPGLLVMRARLAGGATGSAQVGVGSTPLSLQGGTLARGRVASAYNASIQATGGSPPYTYAGSAPAGLTLGATTGVISGVPTTAGTFTFTVTVQAGGQTASASFTIVVDPIPVQDPWLGNYRGTATGGGKQYPMNISLNSIYYAPGNYYNVAPLSVNDPVTNALLYLSYSCSIFGPPSVTTTTGSCPGGRLINVTRSSQNVNGVQRRVLTGTITNMRLDPANPGTTVTLTFSLPEFTP